ncbi:MAG: PfkB family carbohydrate kinase [Anaerolineae bacterium]|jgi:sugar/nucleoside kinase (ribokinase family)
MVEAIVAGHLCLDIIPHFEAGPGESPADYLLPGRLTEVGPATLSTGGAVSNVGINLHRLGIRTELMGKIGDDALGQVIVGIVSSHSRELAQGMITVSGEASSYTLVIDPPGVDRLFLHYAGPNHTFGVEDVRYERLAGARLMHFGYPPLMTRMYADGGQEMAELFRRAKEMGITTSLDLTMPDLAGPSGQADWRAVLARTLPQVDLFVPSLEELFFMLRRERFEELTVRVGTTHVLQALPVEEILSLADETLAMGARILLLKLGTRGAFLRTAPALPELGRGAPADLDTWTGRQLWVPSFQPKAVVSTVGTGDAAIAGFLASVLRGTEPSLALKVAAGAGACCVEKAGALSGVMSWEETLARIAAGWARLPLDLGSTGWHWDGDAAVWRGPSDREVLWL